MVKVSRRGGFSDRQGIKPENTEIQLKRLDDRTRTQIYNLISEIYNNFYERKEEWNPEIQSFIKEIKRDVFCQKVDARNRVYENIFFKDVNEIITNAPYDDVLTLVEAIAEYWEEELEEKYEEEKRMYGNIFPMKKTSICEEFNELFQREYVGYRFIDKQISPISDDIEVSTIKETLANPYEAVTSHFQKAHSLLANREHPDYENSIKESISAVEAICEIITGVRGKEATLGNMLKKLEQRGIVIHSAMKSAFNTLYGYTSDANGIRHAGNIGGKASTFEEAKFMLISCCAFVNYLKGISAD